MTLKILKPTVDYLAAPLLDKGGVVFNVKHPDFGAVGDGLVNDATAIQAALTAAGVLVAHTAWQSRATAVVVLPPGDYLINSTLSVPPGVGIVGSGFSTRIKASNCDAFTFPTSNYILPVPIENLWVDGLNGEGHTAFVVPGTVNLPDRVTGLKFRNLYISYFGRAFYLRTAWETTIRDCQVEAVGIGIAVYGQCARLRIRDCTFNRSGITGTLGTAVGINVDQDVYTGTGAGTYRPEDVTVRGSTFISYDIGANWQRALYAVIRDSVFDYCEVAGISYLQSEGGLTIESNYVALTDRVGASPLYGIQGQAFTGTNPGFASIRNNRVVNLALSVAGGAGILLRDNQDHALVENNQVGGFTHASAYDIRLIANKYNIVRDNVCQSTGITQSIDVNTPTGAARIGTNDIAVGVAGASNLLTANSTTPTVKFGEKFKTQNTVGTAITNFTNGHDGQVIAVELDGVTSLVHGASLQLNGAATMVASSSDTITLRNRAGVWFELARSVVQTDIAADRGDASLTLTPRVDSPVQQFNTPLTAARTITLNPTTIYAGAKFRVIRRAGCTGAFNLDVGGLKTLTAAGQWCDVEYVGSAWILTAYGAL